jgi:hypothetical protein
VTVTRDPGFRVRPASARAFVLAAVALALLALPVAGVTGPTSVIDPAVSPTSATTTTTITFAVTYRHRQGAAPDYVRVVIGSTTHAMTATTNSTDYRNGVRYSVARRLPIGSHAVRFEAMGRDKFVDSIDGPTVTVRSASTPTPTPTPPPRPRWSRSEPPAARGLAQVEQ